MSSSNLKVTIQSDKGKWKRRVDEYASFQLPGNPMVEKSHGSVIVLADGHGGNINSNLCAKISVESLLRFYLEDQSENTIEEKLKNSFFQVHQLVKEKAISFNTPGMECSLTAIVICMDNMWIVNVGSNRVFNIVSDKKFESLIKANQYKIGQSGEILLEISKNTVESSLRLLAVSDGITEFLTEEEICRNSCHLSTTQLVAQLINQGNDKGGEDNMTVVVIETGKRMITTTSSFQHTPPLKVEKKRKSTQNKKTSGFWIWLLILSLIVGGIYLISKNYSQIQLFFERNFLSANKAIINQNKPEPVKVPTLVEESPKASILLSVIPNIATVFFYEGEVSLNDKQRSSYFSSENTPTIIKDLAIGTYTLIIGKEGYEPVRQIIQIKESDLSKQLPLSITLKPSEKEVAKKPPVEPIKPIESSEQKPPIHKPSDGLDELAVFSVPSGAKILLNGNYTGLTTPNTLKIKKGKNNIQILKEGYESANQTIDSYGNGSKRTINLTLKFIPLKVSISSEPSGAKIYLNNIFTSLYTPAILSLSLGPYVITVGKAGFLEQSVSVTVSPGIIIKPISFSLQRKTGTNRYSDGWILPYEN